MDTLFVVAADATTTTVNDDADNEDDFLLPIRKCFFPLKLQSLETESCEYKHNDSHLIYLIIFYIGLDSLSLFVYFFLLLSFPRSAGSLSSAVRQFGCRKLAYHRRDVLFHLFSYYFTAFAAQNKHHRCHQNILNGLGIRFLFFSFGMCVTNVARKSFWKCQSSFWLTESVFVCIVSSPRPYPSIVSLLDRSACMCVQVACEFRAYLCLQIVRFASLLTFY